MLKIAFILTLVIYSYSATYGFAQIRMKTEGCSAAFTNTYSPEIAGYSTYEVADADLWRLESYDKCLTIICADFYIHHPHNQPYCAYGFPSLQPFYMCVDSCYTGALRLPSLAGFFSAKFSGIQT